MESLKSKSDPQLYDPIRKMWVARTPEEIIRQALLEQMVETLGFSFELISVEKEISKLPHLALTSKKEIPQRRVDILVFSKMQEGLSPLLMVECKAVALTPKFAQQVIGYNAFVKAPFVALANEQEILTGWFDATKGLYHFEPGLPSHDALLEYVGKLKRKDAKIPVEYPT